MNFNFRTSKAKKCKQKLRRLQVNVISLHGKQSKCIIIIIIIIIIITIIIQNFILLYGYIFIKTTQICGLGQV